MHAFCKANSSPGGIQSAVWEQTEQVLDLNVSSSVPTLCLIQPGSGAEPEECGQSQDAIIQPSVFFFFIEQKNAGRVCVPKPPTEKSGDVVPFHVYFRKLLGGLSWSCITPAELALLQRPALFIFSQARKLRRA